MRYGTTQRFLQNTTTFSPRGHVVRVEVISALHRGQVETSTKEDLNAAFWCYPATITYLMAVSLINSSDWSTWTKMLFGNMPSTFSSWFDLWVTEAQLLLVGGFNPSEKY